MDLDELLAFKPQKKRFLAEDDLDGEDEKPPSSKRRGMLGGGDVGAAGNGSMVSRGAEAARGQGTGQLNGVSEEEKLKILQSLDDEEEDVGKKELFMLE